MPRRQDHGFRTPTFSHAQALNELIESYGVARLTELCRRLDRRVKRLKAQNFALKARLTAADGEIASLRAANSAAVDRVSEGT